MGETKHIQIRNIDQPPAGGKVLVMDGAGIVVEWTPEAVEIFGWPSAEAIGRKLSELIIPLRHRDAHEMGLKRFVGGGPGALLGRTLEIVAIDRENREFNLEIHIAAEKTADGYRFATSARKLA
jgi:PAS domain-containing protein